MEGGVVLDTSFLVHLASPGAAFHASATRYWREFLDRNIIIRLSTIVVSEFRLKQEIPKTILRACVVLPFNFRDAEKAAELNFTRADRGEASRTEVKDDHKILAQAITNKAAFVISADKDTFLKFARTLAAQGKAQFSSIELGDTFDPSHFELGGQGLLTLNSSS